MKSFVVDTIGSVLFFTLFAACSELFIAGMDPWQVLLARLIMMPVMVITARPYGLWRDWMFSRLAPRQWLTKIVTDIVAFLTFQVPVYVATFAVAGANGSEIGAAVSAAVVFMVLLSRPFGVYLETLRRWAGTSVN